MNMLASIYYPIPVRSMWTGGKFPSWPKDAYDLHIGMIHQHFKLVDVLTAAGRILRYARQGTPQYARGGRIRQISALTGFDVDPEQGLTVSVSQKQTVEIVQVLLHARMSDPGRTDRRADPGDGQATAVLRNKELGVEGIDLVCVNLYHLKQY